jgi:hypothetical protein
MCLRGRWEVGCRRPLIACLDACCFIGDSESSHRRMSLPQLDRTHEAKDTSSIVFVCLMFFKA